MRLLLCALLMALPVCPALAADSLGRDFAYGFLLDIEGDGAIYSLGVPDEVYRTVRQAGLADVRVLNAAGEAVPHLLREQGEKETDRRRRDDVPFFPLTKAAEGGGSTGLAVQVERGADGMIVSIEAGSPADGAGSGRRSYLLDLSRLKTETGRLEFAWENGNLPFTPVSLDESDDLARWRPLVDRAILAELEQGSYRIEQKDIVLPAKPLRYLRLTGREGQGLPILQQVTAVSEKLAARKKRRWLSLGDGRLGEDGERTVVAYDSDYRLEADGVRLRFPEPNSMIRASVQSRPDAKAPWVSRCTAVFYALRVDGAEIGNEACSFAGTHDSHWRLEIVEDGAGLRKSGKAPSLELGWTQAELLFVARGSAPFTLAFGSGRPADEADRPATEMILEAALGQEESGRLIRPASLGRRIELGGKGALQAPPPPLPWKRWLLWAVLCAGVVLLALMVVKLAKEMRRQD